MTMRILTRKKLKEIINFIVKKEEDKYNIDIDMYALSKKELQEKKLEVIDRQKNFPFNFINSKNYFSLRSIYSNYKSDGSIFIGIDNYLKYIPISYKNSKEYFMITLHHEIRHLLQDLNINCTNYLDNIFKIENLVYYFDFKYYIENKNIFLFEIDADGYAYYNVLLMLMHDDNVSKKELDHIKSKIKNYKERLGLYNFSVIFNRLVKLVQKYPVMAKDSFLKIFFNENGVLKDFNVIISNQDFNNLDAKFRLDIVYYYKEQYLLDDDFNNIINKYISNTSDVEIYKERKRLEKVMKLHHKDNIYL